MLVYRDIQVPLTAVMLAAPVTWGTVRRCLHGSSLRYGRRRSRCERRPRRRADQGAGLSTGYPPPKQRTTRESIRLPGPSIGWMRQMYRMIQGRPVRRCCRSQRWATAAASKERSSALTFLATGPA